MRKIILILFLSAIAAMALAGDNPGLGLNETDFNCIVLHPKTEGLLFAGSSRGLYRSYDYGKSWKPVFSPKCPVNCIIIDGNTIYAATAQGLYGSFDAGLSWKLIYRGKGKAKNIISLGANDSYLFLGTEAGLFRSVKIKHSFNKANSGFPQTKVLSISVTEPTLYVATDQGVFKSADNGLIFHKLLAISKEEADEATDADEGESEDELEFQSKIRFIAIDKKNPETVYLGLDLGVRESLDGGRSWKWLSKAGLLEKRINFILPAGRKIYAGTENGLYVYDKDEESWRQAYKGIPATKIKCLTYDQTRDAVWIASDKGIYKVAQGVSCNYFAKDYKDYFSYEPEINTVQKWAIEYAEVEPEKIARWRKQARIRALLPKVSVGWDQSRSDTYEIYTSASTNYCVNGPQDASSGWDVSVSWELGDLVWGTDQTSIDVRSRLMVQLRNDILDDITRTYFERRRLQIELLDVNTNPNKRAEKELRIQELTASLDALTGGGFSMAIRVAKRY